jgi:GNAT superfamily N-acetyltransferase
MTSIKIVEYNKSYAKGVAEMWNLSREGWNGHTNNRTENMVMSEEEQSSYLNLFIALEGERVIGYCKLSKYSHDENTLYVDLINVLPEYYNKKIGKALLLKSIEKTIELNYPRLDLFTWGGNTKAVPLYKKTGFFWEKMESEATHLMNFIPSVLNTELFTDFFKTADWYQDCKREIEICPDGEIVNDFSLYTYQWEKEGKSLTVKYEKTGRGISFVETNEYSIKTSIAQAQLIFGKQYKVIYEIKNKTNKPLSLSLKGVNDKNIEFDYEYQTVIKDNESIEAEFFVKRIDDKQDEWKTHPCVKSEISINNKKAIFKTGIKTLFPLSFSHSTPKPLVSPNIPYELILDVENNFDEPCEYTFNLPANENIKFLPEKLTFTLKAKEKKSLYLKVICKTSVLIKEEIEITAKTNGELINYKDIFSLACYTYSGSTYGETKHNYLINKGLYMGWLNKDDNPNYFIMNKIFSSAFGISTPKIGKPFSSEFDIKKAYKHEFIEDSESITLKTYLESDDFKGCKFINNYKLYHSGVLEYYIEILEFPFSMNEFSINFAINCSKDDFYMPYDNQVMQINDNLFDDAELTNWDLKKITENWVFNKNNNSSIAVIWDKDIKPETNGWSLIFENKFSKDNSRISKPVIIANDVFKTANETREYALNEQSDDTKFIHSIALEVNKGNPFCEKSFTASQVDNKVKSMDCEVVIKSSNDGFSPLALTVKEDERKNQADFEVTLKDNFPNPVLITSIADYESLSFKNEKAVFIKKHSECIKKQADKLLSLNNGIIEIKTNPDFAPCLFSLIAKGNEWLDTNYPHKTVKSWWNPWTGGIYYKLPGLNMKHLVEEKSTATFITKKDNYLNEWTGFEIKTEIENFKPSKGLTLIQYFLTIPNLPIVCSYLKIEQKTGKYLNTNIQNISFIKADNILTNCSFEYEYKGKTLKTKCGKDHIGFVSEASMVSFAGINREEKLIIYNSDLHPYKYVESDIHISSCTTYQSKKIKNQDVCISPPKFFIISDEELKEKHLIDLKNIRFTN